MTLDADTGSSRNGIQTSTFNYDTNGRISGVYIADGRSRSVTFVVDVLGQVLTRVEADNDAGHQDPSTRYWYFDGQRIGQVTNNADYVSTYVAEMTGRSLTPNNTMGPFIGNQSSPNDGVDFDLAYQALTPGAVRSTNANWTVRDGDTLQSMASAVWGDASLWYLIAEANGLTSASILTAGQLLTVPARAGNVHNTTDTFRPYDPNEALGNLNPTQPKPPKKGGGCGVVGQIIMVAIAVAVTAVTAGALAPAAGAAVAALGSGAVASTAVAVGVGAVAGAAGSIASQAFGVATGLQDSFDWKAVGMSALSGGVGNGLGTVIGGTGFVAGAARGAAGSVITQGVAVATGLQDRFSWTDVAVGAVTGGVGSQLNDTFGVPQDSSTWSRGHYAAAAASSVLSGVAGAGARSLLEGSSFGDNLRAVLPQVIGQTIGNMAAGRIQARQVEKPTASSAGPSDGFYVDDETGQIDPNRYFMAPEGRTYVAGGISAGGQPTAQRSLWQKIGGFLKDPIGSTVRAGRAFVGAVAERIDYTKASASATYASLSDDAIQLEDIVVTGVRDTQRRVSNFVDTNWMNYRSAIRDDRDAATAYVADRARTDPMAQYAMAQLQAPASRPTTTYRAPDRPYREPIEFQLDHIDTSNAMKAEAGQALRDAFDPLNDPLSQMVSLGRAGGLYATSSLEGLLAPISGTFDYMGQAPHERHEEEADAFARNALLTAVQWDLAVSRFSRTEKAVLTDAKRFGVGPAVIAGRVRREAGDYTVLRSLVGAGEVRRQFGL